jgi:hypothetical protein
VGHRAGLDAVVKRKILSPCRESNPPIIQPVAHRYTTELSRILLLHVQFPNIHGSFCAPRLALILFGDRTCWSVTWWLERMRASAAVYRAVISASYIFFVFMLRKIKHDEVQIQLLQPQELQLLSMNQSKVLMMTPNPPLNLTSPPVYLIWAHRKIFRSIFVITDFAVNKQYFQSSPVYWYMYTYFHLKSPRCNLFGINHIFELLSSLKIFMGENMSNFILCWNAY